MAFLHLFGFVFEVTKSFFKFVLSICLIYIVIGGWDDVFLFVHLKVADLIRQIAELFSSGERSTGFYFAVKTATGFGVVDLSCFIL